MKEFLSCAKSFIKAKVLILLEEGSSGEEEVVEGWSNGKQTYPQQAILLFTSEGAE